MKSREHVITGLVNEKGQLMISDKERMSVFFSEWKNTKFIGRFIVAQSGSSAAIKGYYYNKIIPDFRQARWENGERASEEDTEKWCRELCPILWEEIPDDETGEYYSRLREINELDNMEMSRYIEHLKQIASEEYFFNIIDLDEL